MSVSHSSVVDPNMTVKQNFEFGIDPPSEGIFRP